MQQVTFSVEIHSDGPAETQSRAKALAYYTRLLGHLKTVIRWGCPHDIRVRVVAHGEPVFDTGSDRREVDGR